MAVLKNRTITRNEKVNGEKKEVWKIVGRDVTLMCDNKELRNVWADDHAWVLAQSYLRTLERDEADEITRQPISYNQIEQWRDDMRTGRGRPSLASQIENLSPEDAARARQMAEKLKEMGIRI